MFNKLYEWIGTGIASLRNGAPANDQGEGVQQDGQNRRKRQINCVEDGEAVNQEDAVVKKFRMGDWIDTVKIAAKGVKTQGSSVASWVKSSVGPSLSNILPASPGPPPLAPPPEASPASRPATPSWAETEFQMGTPGSLRETFIMPSSTLTWKSCKSVHAEPLRMDRPVLGPRAFGRPSYADVPRGEAPKTNGHSATLPPALAPRPCPSPRLGRTLNLTPRRSPSSPASTGGSAGSPFTSMYEKTFPIRVVQSPSHSSSARLRRRRAHCTAQESVQMEEKEVYRQLLTMVSEGQSALFRDGTSCTGLRSHRDLTSFLSSSRRLLQSAHPAGSSEGASAPSSPRPESSLGSSVLPSPRDGSGGAETPLSSPGPGAAPAEPPEPAASPAQQGDWSHNALSSDPNGDSLIFVKEQPGKKQDASSVPCFHAELWIKELTSLYDSRARERRRLIEEQEALTARLFRQRLSEEGHVGRGGVELQVRVPLEKEVPLAPVVAEIKAAPEEPEFPELTEAMQLQVSQALRGGSQDEVLSEGFRLTITRKDIQTLNNLNWLNDEVINFYMNMLVERSQRPGLPSVYTFNTFFYPKLRGAGFPAVRRWTKKVDVFASDILLVPVHLGVHWCLSVVDFRKKRVTYFDSMGGINDEACRVLLKYLEQESQDKKGKQLDTSDWVLQSMKRSEIPQQMNGSDCGMFTCKYAEYITKDRPITFTQKHMPYFRRRMVWEILNRKLL
ncbi:sentrin-specific protease 1 [Anguilla anguilla]|uniref:sentrin-specific protease 1 n=1 Tax=Anguilla anguilla TaxID=7936 RepID=UPI0015A937F0|nr:sentrin-specific protease 1 [Anguilla anguilla]XP_035239551.1 sentrin-specific protease 1 [Anguilla anguilla]